jgi:hypothetical protein
LRTDRNEKLNFETKARLPTQKSSGGLWFNSVY